MRMYTSADVARPSSPRWRLSSNISYTRTASDAMKRKPTTRNQSVINKRYSSDKKNACAWLLQQTTAWGFQHLKPCCLPIVLTHDGMPVKHYSLCSSFQVSTSDGPTVVEVNVDLSSDDPDKSNTNGKFPPSDNTLPGPVEPLGMSALNH